MKTTRILSALMMILSVVFLVQCEKYGNKPDRPELADDDSERPGWAGGGDDVNPHQNPNPSPGISKGGDYGDLYELYRTEVDGVPILIEINDEWYVQPIGPDDGPLDLNGEGELDDPTLATAVEFGRLNIVRSPANVLQQALDEAMKVLKQGEVPGREIRDIHLDFCGRLVGEYSDDGGLTIVFKAIDSPRESMAIYKEIMQKEFSDQLDFLGDYFSDPLTMAASCFAAGSDKTGTVTKDEMLYINGFMECAGLDPIINDDEYDSKGDLREYFDFTSYGFDYDRSVYETRWIQCLIGEDGTVFWPDEDGISLGPRYTILGIFDAREIPFVGGAEFMYRNADMEAANGADLFAIAIDDAVQVLDYVHGNSNLRFTDIDGIPLYVNE